MNDLKRPLIAVHVGVGGPVGPIDRKQTFQDCLSLFRVKLVVDRALPVYPGKQTISEPVGTSHFCQSTKSLRG
jgi:hypothetical protein